MLHTAFARRAVSAHSRRAMAQSHAAAVPAVKRFGGVDQRSRKQGPSGGCFFDSPVARNVTKRRDETYGPPPLCSRGDLSAFSQWCRAQRLSQVGIYGNTDAGIDQYRPWIMFPVWRPTTSGTNATMVKQATRNQGTGAPARSPWAKYIAKIGAALKLITKSTP